MLDKLRRNLVKGNDGATGIQTLFVMIGFFLMYVLIVVFLILFTYYDAAQEAASLSLSKQLTLTGIDIYQTQRASTDLTFVADNTGEANEAAVEFSDEELTMDFAKYLGAVYNGNKIMGYQKERVAFIVSDVHVQMNKRDSLKTTVSYHIDMPLYLLSEKPAFQVSLDVQVSPNKIEKWE